MTLLGKFGQNLKPDVMSGASGKHYTGFVFKRFQFVVQAIVLVVTD